VVPFQLPRLGWRTATPDPSAACHKRRLKLGDAIIAATALTHRMPLVTRNTDDFAGIPGLRLIDPLAP
jgi:predicted nucleic acid-binding protein